MSENYNSQCNQTIEEIAEFIEQTDIGAFGDLCERDQEIFMQFMKAVVYDIRNMK